MFTHNIRRTHDDDDDVLCSRPSAFNVVVVLGLIYDPSSRQFPEYHKYAINLTRTQTPLRSQQALLRICVHKPETEPSHHRQSYRGRSRCALNPILQMYRMVHVCVVLSGIVSDSGRDTARNHYTRPSETHPFFFSATTATTCAVTAAAAAQLRTGLPSC